VDNLVRLVIRVLAAILDKAERLDIVVNQARQAIQVSVGPVAILDKVECLVTLVTAVKVGLLDIPVNQERLVIVVSLVQAAIVVVALVDILVNQDTAVRQDILDIVE
jgi:hypothetical protein